MTTEANIQREVMLAASQGGDTLWRNNVGKGWVAPPNRTIRATKPMTVRLNPGDVVLRDAFRITWGLTPGSSDLIGIRPTIITPEMVGQIRGLFLALEVKTPRGRVTGEQRTFIQHVLGRGGIAKVVRGVEDIP